VRVKLAEGGLGIEEISISSIISSVDLLTVISFPELVQMIDLLAVISFAEQTIDSGRLGNPLTVIYYDSAREIVYPKDIEKSETTP